MRQLTSHGTGSTTGGQAKGGGEAAGSNPKAGGPKSAARPPPPPPPPSPAHWTDSVELDDPEQPDWEHTSPESKVPQSMLLPCVSTAQKSEQVAGSLWTGESERSESATSSVRPSAGVGSNPNTPDRGLAGEAVYAPTGPLQHEGVPATGTKLPAALDTLQLLEPSQANRQPSGAQVSSSLWATKLASAADWVRFGTGSDDEGNADDLLYAMNELVGNGSFWTSWALAPTALRGAWDPCYFSPPPLMQRSFFSTRSRVLTAGDS